MSDTLIICTGEHSNDDLARIAGEYLLDDETAAQMAGLFKALADPTRVRIIGLLAHTEMCVGDLHQLLGMTQPAISHQLRILRDLHLVRSRKDGRHVYYTLDDDHVHDLFQQSLTHISHD